MFHTATKIVKWISIPLLLAAAVFPRSAAGYEFLVDFAICLGAIFFVLWAARSREYLCAAGFAAIAVAFSPFFLVVKIFLMLGFISIGSCITLLASFRTKPEAAV